MYTRCMFATMCHRTLSILTVTKNVSFSVKNSFFRHVIGRSIAYLLYEHTVPTQNRPTADRKGPTFDPKGIKTEFGSILTEVEHIYIYPALGFLAAIGPGKKMAPYVHHRCVASRSLCWRTAGTPAAAAALGCPNHRRRRPRPGPPNLGPLGSPAASPDRLRRPLAGIRAAAVPLAAGAAVSRSHWATAAGCCPCLAVLLGTGTAAAAAACLGVRTANQSRCLAYRSDRHA